MTNGGVLAAATWGEWILQPSSWLVILQVAGGLGFVIFVHELGHFLVAKACGVKCEKFYLGFDVGGLKLLSFKWGETEYGIGALPLGGYVKMLGQDDNPAAAAAEAQRAKAAGPGHVLTSGDLPPEPGIAAHPAWDPRSYPAQSVPKRMAIISAGVIMNVIFAVLMASLAYGLGVREQTSTLSAVVSGGPAWQAGLRTGDDILKIGDRENPVFEDLRRGVTVSNRKTGVIFTIRRPPAPATRTVTIHPDSSLGAPSIGVLGPSSLVFSSSFGDGLSGAAADAAPPIKPNDIVRSIDGVAIATYAELIAALARKIDKPVTLGVERLGQGNEGSTQLDIVLPPQRRRVFEMTLHAGAVAAVQAGSPAALAGLEPGHEIRLVNGDELGDPLTLDDRLASCVGEPVTLTISRDGKPDQEVTVTPREVTWWDDELRGKSCPVSVASLGIALSLLPTVAEVDEEGPAGRAGIKKGDRLTAATFVVPGEKNAKTPIQISDDESNWPAIMQILQDTPVGTKLLVDAQSKSDKPRKVELEPIEAEGLYAMHRGLEFEPVYRKLQARSVGEAFRRGLQKTQDDLGLVYVFLAKLTRNEISPRLLGGPITIAAQAGKAAEEGFSRLLLFLTMLSANLAVVNFLPIPVLDGGHMVFLLYELVFRKPPSDTVVAILSYCGLALILSLMVFVFGLDLTLISRK